MFQCNHHHQGAHYLSLLKLQLLKQSIKNTSVLLTWWCIVIDCFNKGNFSKLK